MAFEDIAIAVTVLLAACAAVVAVWSAVKAVREMRKPAADLAATVEAHSRMLDNDNRRLGELEQANRLLLRGMRQLIEHELDGNHTDKLAEVGQDIEDWLINR